VFVREAGCTGRQAACGQVGWCVCLTVPPVQPVGASAPIGTSCLVLCIREGGLVLVVQSRLCGCVGGRGGCCLWGQVAKLQQLQVTKCTAPATAGSPAAAGRNKGTVVHDQVGACMGSCGRVCRSVPSRPAHLDQCRSLTCCMQPQLLCSAVQVRSASSEHGWQGVGCVRPLQPSAAKRRAQTVTCTVLGVGRRPLWCGSVFAGRNPLIYQLLLVLA
jgi:hypothetical protein